jgi:hypothetical protein
VLKKRLNPSWRQLLIMDQVYLYAIQVAKPLFDCIEGRNNCDGMRRKISVPLENHAEAQVPDDCRRLTPSLTVQSK